MQKNDLIRDRGGCRCDCLAPDARHACEAPRFAKCGCGEPIQEPSWGLKTQPLASVYSVLQSWNEIYDLDTALKRGTIFKELDLPFYGGACSGDGEGRSRCGGGCNGR